ncbi:hypothetical protein ASF92_12500 [Pedobacter sp. Leaf176]|nr:hypothetical protein ASF92_12500 [Pedobacter sp. Leaf176]
MKKTFGRTILNVSLLQLEIRKAKYKNLLFARIWAFMLLFLFLSALIIESIHCHEKDIHLESGNELAKQSDI